MEHVPCHQQLEVSQIGVDLSDGFTKSKGPAFTPGENLLKTGENFDLDDWLVVVWSSRLRETL